jgi:hypothetical protein
MLFWPLFILFTIKTICLQYFNTYYMFLDSIIVCTYNTTNDYSRLKFMIAELNSNITSGKTSTKKNKSIIYYNHKQKKEGVYYAKVFRISCNW